MNYITPDIEVKKAFQKVEQVQELLEVSINGISLYAVCRFYLEMCYRIGYYENCNKPITLEAKTETPQLANNTPILKFTLIKRIKAKASNYWHTKKVRKELANYTNQFDELKPLNTKVDYIFIATSGWKDKQNHSIELYNLIKQVKKEGKSIAFVLPNYDTKIKRRKEYDYFYSIDINEKKTFSLVEENEVQKFQKLVKLHVPYVTQSNIDGLVTHIQYTFSLANQLSKVIEFVKPKYVIARSLYTDKWVTQACYHSNVKSIEIQHGVFTSNNFYYQSLGKLTDIQLLLPNYVMCLGQAWLKILHTASSTWNEKNSGVIGAELQVKTKPLNKPLRKVTIAFQDFATDILDIRHDITCFLTKYHQQFSNVEFYLRVHPANSINTLSSLKDFENIKFSNPITETIADILAETDVLICATSMVMYEALNLDIPVISLERFRYMCEPTHVNFVANEDELLEILLQSAYKIPQQPNYITNFSITNFNNLVNDNV